MGYRCRWFAVEQDRRDAALTSLGLRLGEQADEPVYDTGLYGSALETGWFVVFADGRGDMDRLSEDDARSLSAEGRAIFFHCNDGDMMTRMAEFERGVERWSLTHDGSKGEHEMVVAGSPPPRALEMLAEQTAAQEAADPDAEYPVDHIYDVTAAFGLEMLGFRHDTTLCSDDFPPVWELEQALGSTTATTPTAAADEPGPIAKLLNRLRW